MKELAFQIRINGEDRVLRFSSDFKKAISEVNKEIARTNDPKALERLENTLVELKARQAEVNKEVRESIKERQRELTAVDKSSGAYDKLSKELNEARKRYKDLAAAEQESTEEAQQLLRQITLLDGKLKDIDGSVGQFQRNVGNYPSAFNGIADSINNIRNASGTLAKGLGIAAAGFQLFNIASDAIDQLNASLEETRIISAQIQTFTGTTGEALQTQVAQAKAVANTYKQDVQDLSVSTNSFSKAFADAGISFNDALTLIEAGFRKGANAQGDFLDNLQEYPAQFRDAGASAEQFIAISIAAANEGIFSDKGLDAVKEFGLRIREQTKATGDALRNSLGSEFTNQLFSDLNKGAINTVDALGKVTRALKENGVQGAELQTVIADVFGGPGEDVGQRFLFTLGDILETTENVTESTTEYQQQLGELFEANLELENAQKGYNEALADFSFELEVAKTRTRTFFAELLAGLLRFGDQFPATLKAAGAGFREFFQNFTFNPVKSTRNFFEAYNKTFKEEVRKIKDENELQKAILDQVAPQTGEPPIKKPVRKLAKTVGEELIKGSVAEIEKRKSDLDKAFERAVAGSDAQRAIAANLEKINAELEEAIAKQNRILFEAERKAIQEGLEITLNILGEILEKNAPDADILSKTLKPITDTTKTITADIEKIVGVTTKNTTEIVKQTTEEIKKLEDQATQSFDNIVSSSEQIFGAALDVLGAFQDARSEREQEAFDLQIEQIDENISALEEKQQNVGRIRAKQIQREIDAAKRQREAAEKQAEEAQKKAAKREKTLALLQAVVQGSLAVIRALAAPPGFPFNLPSVLLTGTLAAAQVAVIAAQPLAEGGVITGRRVTDRQNIPTTSKGDNVLAVVKRGEVVLNERQQALLGGNQTFKALRIPGFADGGVIGAPPLPAPVASMPMQASTEILQAINEKTDAINARIDRLKVFVVSEEVRNDLNEGDALKAQATL